MGVQHLGVVHDLTFVRGHLQRGQHIVHPRQAGGAAGRGAVKSPLENVEARPAGYVGALLGKAEEGCWIRFCFETNRQ